MAAEKDIDLARPPVKASRDDIHASMAGIPVPNDTGVAVRIENLCKSFDGRVVLSDIDLTVARGTIVSIIGQSGGGKTTLMRCINLLERPDSGSITLNGNQPVVADGKVVVKSVRKLRQSVGMVFQQFNLFPHLTAIENVTLAQMHSANVDEKKAIETAARLLKSVDLAHRALAFPDQMSGGEKQRVAIARALALDPTVLLFDEPTSALDPESTQEVLRVMRRLAEKGMTMVLVTHELAFARDVSDHVVFIDGGRVVEQGPPMEIFDNPRERRTAEYVRRQAGTGRQRDRGADEDGAHARQ